MASNIRNENAMNNDKMKLSDASRELRVPYQRFFIAVTGGKVPAERSNSGSRWFVKRTDLPAIAEVLGVEAPTLQAA